MDNKISELLLTRLSHDLVGNIGAISNGFELIAEEADMDFIKDTCVLLSDSSNFIAKRIKFFRLAFGLGNKATSDREEFLPIIKDYLTTIGNKDFPINFALYINDDLNIKQSKIVMALSMILADMTIRGGDITVRGEGGVMELSLVADRLAPIDRIDELKNIVNRQGDMENAKTSPLYYACLLTEDLGKNIDLASNEKTIKFIIK